ncbi:MAG: T9SS type A sorting domain-containing protein, partial [Bacteroidales bacterium]|nr:T9SS type A sorting domain-containing protein [Bacteroidales bacterium]
YNHGDNVSLTATANTGYTFVNWTENGNSISTNPSLPTFSATANRTLVANFTLNSYPITASVIPVNSGTITGAGTYNHGDNVSLTATANTGYTFVNWTENGNSISTNPSLPTFSATANRTLVANFRLTTSINDFENISNISVYPNPVSNELIIRIEGNTTKLKFEIFNSIGQSVFKGEFIESTVIQTRNFVSGIYLIKFENGKTFEFKKVIKQ